MRSEEYWPNLLFKSSPQVEQQIAAETKVSSDDQEDSKLRPVRKNLVTAVSITRSLVGDLITKSSDANELFRLTAWILRFISNCRIKEEARRCKKPLNNQEIDDAIRFWLRREQAIYYQKEIQIIKDNFGRPADEAKPTDRISAIHKFIPFMREDRVLRLG